MTNFDRAVQVVLEREGVFANEPTDPGGETVYGISRVYHPHINWPPTKEEAIEIYRVEYWNAIQCDTYPYPVALALFDCAVNQGPSHAKQIAYQTPEGDWHERLASVLAYRTQLYVQTNPTTYTVYHHGWFRRLFLICMAATQE